jgi:hypothetical protein
LRTVRSFEEVRLLYHTRSRLTHFAQYAACMQEREVSLGIESPHTLNQYTELLLEKELSKPQFCLGRR